jgi:hypothetical protein
MCIPNVTWTKRNHRNSYKIQRLPRCSWEGWLKDFFGFVFRPLRYCNRVIFIYLRVGGNVCIRDEGGEVTVIIIL